MSTKIYLDNAATTPLDSKVLKAMLPYLRNNYGNPSSLHWLGRMAHQAITEARQKISLFLGCSAEEIFFTGSATESDNLVIQGIVKSAIKNGIIKPHLIVSAIEHPAVLEPVKNLEKNGTIEVTYLSVNKEGIVDLEILKESLKKNTILVSIMYANNEIGTIQPIHEISQIIKTFKKENHFSFLFFHTDAVQAAGYLNCNVEELGVDFLTLSAHKIYGPKGIGLLYKRKQIEIEPLILGGHQETGLRAGTENVAAIVGFKEAILQVEKNKKKNEEIRKLRDKLIEGILKKIPHTFLNGSWEKRLPNNVNITFKGVEGESLLMSLDEKGVAVSTGSACASGNLMPSHVLMALGRDAQTAHSSLRFTLGKQNTQKEIDYVLKILPEIVKKLRLISGFRA